MLLMNFMTQLLSYNTQCQLVSYLVYIRQNMPMSLSQLTRGTSRSESSFEARHVVVMGFFAMFSV